jgi:cell division transport system permease protein
MGSRVMSAGAADVRRRGRARAAPAVRWSATLAIVGNALRFFLVGAVRSWFRNLSGTVPALGSMTILLVAAGLFGLSGFALWNLAIREVDNAAVLHVYLRDGISDGDRQQLQAQLRQEKGVLWVGYTSKQQALAQAQQRPGLADLASAADANPFPASLDVKVRRVQDLEGLASSVKGSPLVDRIYPTSFNDGYHRLEQWLTWLEVAGVVVLLVLGLVAVMVTANSIRAAIMARHDEVTIMQLVGAARWMVRGPFVLEGALTGAVAGLIGFAVTLMAGLAAVAVGARSFSQLLPGITPASVLVISALVLLAGLVLGSVSSLVGIHKHLES